jgi:ubiquinone/menaquinone biosynthesis C-methylase UbiE
MGWYAQVIVPRLCDLILNRPLVGRYRRKFLIHAEGAVLEIGFGTGLNLPHYPAAIRKITSVDPSPGMQRLAGKRIKETGIEVTQHLGSSERLAFADRTFDCVVSTFTLCSIENVAQAMAEVYRVLRPGGKFLFLEHGLSPEPSVQKWQRRFNWLQKCLANGCHLDRPIKTLVAVQPFASLQVQEFYLEKTPRIQGYVYGGLAIK